MTIKSQEIIDNLTAQEFLDMPDWAAEILEGERFREIQNGER